MDFASEFVYEYLEPEFEVISDEEFDKGMELSDSSDSDSDCEVAADKDVTVADSVGVSASKAKVKEPVPKKKKINRGHWRKQGDQATPNPEGRRERRADTNIVSLNFQTLVRPSNMHTGDAVYCEGCQAILSHISNLQTGDEKIWECEFCGRRNVVDIEPEEKPAQDDVTFMLSPALSTTVSGPTGEDTSMVVFCVDISGSMCITTEVPGKISLRGGNLHRLRRMNDDGSDQYLPRQKRNVTYVSRLQAAQAAVDQQLEEMMKQHPNRRVALIVFNNEVVVIGDGSGTPVTIAGDKLTNQEELEKISSDLALPNSIRGTRKILGDRLFELEEGGATALGPALVVALTIASKQAGSKVIICTDGLANVGLGRLDQSTQEAQASSLEFYSSVASSAVEKGVSVSVISMKGTDCKLIQLGMVADSTGGQMNIVDPLKLTQEFSTILQDRIIATNVVATFILHNQLFFHYEETEESRVVRNVGNVTLETEITFEYGIRTKTNKGTQSKQGATSESSDQPQAGSSKVLDGARPIDDPSSSTTKGEDNKKRKELPFQLQVKYTDTEGATALRVLTKTKPVTNDRNVAERDVNLDVFGRHTAQLSANLALEGNYTQARSRGFMNQRLAWRYKKNRPEKKAVSKQMYSNLFGKVKSVENYMMHAQKSEQSRFGSTHSDSEEDDEGAQCMDAVSERRPGSIISHFSKGKAKKKLMKRQTDTTDETAQMLFDLKHTNFKE